MPAATTTAGVVSSKPDLVNWIQGPAVADLGAAAQIQIPAGFQFANGADAAVILRNAGNPTPPTIVGLLTPAGGAGYIVVFEYNPIGYVKTKDNETVDAETALEALQVALRNQRSPVVLEWEKAPAFDSERHSLEWSIAVIAGERRSVNQTVRLLGREGVLDAIGIRSTAAGGAIPLKQLMTGVSFKSGYGYKEFRKGDRVALHRLSDLAANETPAPHKAEVNYLWPSVAGGAVLLAGCGAFIIVRRRKRHAARPAHGHGSVRILLNAAASRRLEYTYPHLASKENGTANGNGHHHGANGHGKAHRRRVFDYQRFYSDLLFEVSDRGSQGSPAPARRLAPVVTTPVKSELSDSINPAVANLGLIEHQKRLIEEQQRLIREQAKLIEEKTRLIQEKNQVLDKQAELFGNLF